MKESSGSMANFALISAPGYRPLRGLRLAGCSRPEPSHRSGPPRCALRPRSLPFSRSPPAKDPASNPTERALCPRRSEMPQETRRSGWMRIRGRSPFTASARPRTSIPRGRHGVLANRSTILGGSKKRCAHRALPSWMGYSSMDASTREQRPRRAQELLHARIDHAVGHESPGAHQAARAQAGEVLGDAGSPQDGRGGDLADGSRTLPQREQAGEAGGIGQVAEEHGQRRGRRAGSGGFFDYGGPQMIHNHAGIRYHVEVATSGRGQRISES